MNILENSNISFVKTKKNVKILKYADMDDWDMIHMTVFSMIQAIEEIIINIDFPLKGDYVQ